MSATRNSWRVLIVGAGVAGLEAVLALRTLAADQISVEIVAPESQFAYRPLAVAEPFRVGDVKRFPLRRLAEVAGAGLRNGLIARVDAAEKAVTLEDGQELGYESLLLALGAQPREAISGALTFCGPQDVPALSALLDSATAGEIHRIAFVVPAGAAWSLPLYELSLLTSEYLSARGTRRVEILLFTPEDRPLALFGLTGSNAIAELLALREIRVETSVVAVAFDQGVLTLAAERSVAADAVVALPRLEGPRIKGVPHDANGFVPTNEYGCVLGLADVFAAGDLTQFPLKQGGTATQQADAAASSIAADAGVPVKPEPFRPVVRGLLLTGLTPRFLRAKPTAADWLVSTEPLWRPPAKIVGRYLTPFLAAELGLAETAVGPVREAALPIEVDLETGSRPAWSRV